MKKTKSSKNQPKIILMEGGAVINVGLTVFEDALKQQGVRVISVQINTTHVVPQDLQSILNKLL